MIRVWGMFNGELDAYEFCEYQAFSEWVQENGESIELISIDGMF